MLWKVFLTLFIIWLCILQWRKRKFYQLARKLKNNYRSWPVFGHSLMFMGNDEDRMTVLKSIGEEALRQGGMTSVWLGSRLFIMIAEPEAAECLLRNCLEKDDVVRFSKYVVGNGSIFAPVSIWRPRRRILSPTFSHRNLNEYVRIFAKQSNVMVSQLRNRVERGPFPIWSYLTTYTMDSICETTLGVQLNAQKNPDQPFLKAFSQYCHLITRKMCLPWLHNEFVYKFHPDFKALTESRDCMTSFIKKIIKSKIDECNENNMNDDTNSYKTFLDLLINSNNEVKGFTEIELEEESLVIVMAGTDTSAVGIAFTIVTLSWYQDVQEKVYEELKQVFGDSNRAVEPEDLLRLKYLEAVIKETFRLYPPVPATVRKVTSDLLLPSGLTVLKDCGVVVNIWALHRNQKYWGADADTFNPDRFLNSELKHPMQYAAFSFGARNCVGYLYAMLSAKTALATILRHYRITSADSPVSYSAGRPLYKPLRLKFGLMMKDVDNFMVKLETRN